MAVYCFLLLFIGLYCYQGYPGQFCGSSHLMNGTEPLQGVMISRLKSPWRVILRTLECFFPESRDSLSSIGVGVALSSPRKLSGGATPLSVPHYLMKFHQRMFGFLLPVTQASILNTWDVHSSHS